MDVRAQAQREYQQARSEGRKAALVEQHRPNVFTTAVASLGPGEEAVIEIEYQETAHFENGEYRLRFPMVVAPRYHPPDHQASGPGAQASEYVRTSLPEARGPRPEDLTLTVDLSPGLSLREIRSPHHRIAQQTLDHDRYRVVLDRENVPTDRDFELVWRPDLGTLPTASVVTEDSSDYTYALLVVTPPEQSPVRVARETIFIIDSSGSMSGESIEQARQALLLALDDLGPRDTFNIIDFDSEARALFTVSQFAARPLVEQAKNFVRGLEADGGTEMLRAIQLALPSGPVNPGTVRQIIFITDGQVGNEQQLFRYVREHLGDSRLFTVGIGSAPNSHFMRNAARYGRGTFTYIGDLSQVQSRMSELFEKLGSPVMTSIDVTVDDPDVEIWPARVPDLYRGEPLVVTLRVKDATQPVTLRGRIGNETWMTRLQLTDPLDDSGIGKLWARQKIESMTDRLSEGVDPAIVRSEVLPIALRHRLVTQYTSLVAIDQLALNPSLEGTLPQTATPAQLYLIAGLALIAAAIVARRLA